jgi:hypothetical protein
MVDEIKTEIAVSITENGKEWSSLRVPADRWPEAVEAVSKMLAIERPILSELPKPKRRITITDTGNGFLVDLETPDSTFPTTEKPTAREAVARAMQLLDMKWGVQPQDFPERVCIGQGFAEKEGV